jgi:glycosyltransferase involved in cell wall biosynthesis
MTPLRIGFDIRYLSHGLTGGVRTYVRQLANVLPRLAPNDQFFFYADAKAPLDLAPPPANVTIRTLPWRSRVSSLWNDWALSGWMARDGVAVAHFPGNYGPSGAYRLVVTVHDALNLFPMSEHLRGFGRTPSKVAMMLYLGSRTRAALRQAEMIITDSDFSRQDIAARGGISTNRIVTVHAAADARFQVLPGDTLARERSRLGFPEHVILADAIKNPAVVVAAWRKLPEGLRARTEVVFFSREAAPRPELAADLAAHRAVRFLPQPSVDELIVLMNLADVFVFPSYFEGFGLPIVEAMQCGLPVIGSARGSIPEVVGDAGLIFPLEDGEVAAAHVHRVLDDTVLKSTLRAASLRRAQAFSWERTAAATLDVYRRVMMARAAN